MIAPRVVVGAMRIAGLRCAQSYSRRAPISHMGKAGGWVIDLS